MMGNFRRGRWKQGKCAEGGEQVVSTCGRGREEGRWAIEQKF